MKLSTLLSASLLMFSVLFTFPACSGDAKKDVKSGLDVADLVCDQLNLQDEPDWVKYACTATDVGGKVLTVFQAKVPKDKAPSFAARYARPQHKQ